MNISTIIWQKVKVVSFKTWDWENCTITFSKKNGTAWIQRIENGATTDDNLLIGIKEILELTPWSFKATGTCSNGTKLIKATIEAKF